MAAEGAVREIQQLGGLLLRGSGAEIGTVERAIGFILARRVLERFGGFLKTSAEDQLYGLRRDSYLQLGVSYHF